MMQKITEHYEINTEQEINTERENIKEGTAWKLGRHILIYGDSTKQETYKILQQENIKATLIIADPPYSMKKENQGVLNDNLTQNQLNQFNKHWLHAIKQYTTPQASIYIFGTDTNILELYRTIFYKEIQEHNIELQNILTWDKIDAPRGQNNKEAKSYPSNSEKILFLTRGDNDLSPNAKQYYKEYDKIRLYLIHELEKAEITKKDIRELFNYKATHIHWLTESQYTMISENTYTKLQKYITEKEQQTGKQYNALQKPYHELYKEYEEIRYNFEKTRTYFNNTHKNMTDIFNIRRPHYTEKVNIHPTQKPLELLRTIIKTSSRHNDTIIDPFSGSGSTLISCEQTQRNCITIEYNKKFIPRIIQRYENLTGQQAEKIQT